MSQRAQWAGGETIASVLMARTLDQPELVSLAAGFVDHETLPVDPVRRALESIHRGIAALARAVRHVM
ncbi:MAG: hypothetical protein RBS80_17035 [Thermoguttaceae bacterium]|nr:hypothetical protein [Thermoguttaceae bacterium]